MSAERRPYRDDNGEPRYRQVAEILMAEIKAGEPPVGSLLPTELELCARFGVSRFTMREALRWLREAGLISRRRGSGTVVTAQQPTRRFIQPLGSIADLLQYARTARLRLDRVARVQVAGEAATLLRSPPGTEWLRLEGLRFDTETSLPLALTRVYVNAMFGGVESAFEGAVTALYTLIEERYGLTITRIEQRIAAVALSAEEAARLHVAPGTPGLRTWRWYYDGSGRLIELSDTIHPAQRFTYEMVYTRDQLG